VEKEEETKQEGDNKEITNRRRGKIRSNNKESEKKRRNTHKIFIGKQRNNRNKNRQHNKEHQRIR